MNKNPIINYYLFISIWDSFPTGWNSFLFFLFLYRAIMLCGQLWLAITYIFFLLFLWDNLNLTTSTSLKRIWMKMKKNDLPELIMWININQNYLYGRSLGLSKKPAVQTQNLHHNDIFCCLMPRTESRTSLTFPGMFIYIQWQENTYTILWGKMCI